MDGAKKDGNDPLHGCTDCKMSFCGVLDDKLSIDECTPGKMTTKIIQQQSYSVGEPGLLPEIPGNPFSRAK